MQGLGGAYYKLRQNDKQNLIKIQQKELQEVKGRSGSTRVRLSLQHYCFIHCVPKRCIRLRCFYKPTLRSQDTNHSPSLAHTTCPTLCWGAGVCQGRCSCSGTQPPSAVSSDATAGKTHLESHTLSRPHFNQAVTSVPLAHSLLARISHTVCPSQGRELTAKCGVWLTVWQASL